MNESQLRKIEKKFNVGLPDSYRSLLKKPPTILAAALRQEDKECPGQIPLFLDVDCIIHANQLMRDPEHPDYFGFGPSDDPEPWPDKYFIIAAVTLAATTIASNHPAARL